MFRCGLAAVTSPLFWIAETASRPMAETKLVSPELAAELSDELSRLRAARAMNPKHGTRAGAAVCDDRCQVCSAEAILDVLIGQIPRGPHGRHS